MIRTENLTIGERAFVRTYSDEGRYVVRDGVSYEEAVDPAEFNRQYTEGDLIDYDVNETELASIFLEGVE